MHDQQHQINKLNRRLRQERRGFIMAPPFQTPANETLIARLDRPFRQWQGYTALYHKFVIDSLPGSFTGFPLEKCNITLAAISRCDGRDQFDKAKGYGVARKRLMIAWQKAYKNGALISKDNPLDGVYAFSGDLTQDFMEKHADKMYRDVGNCG
jgi:hypothetical protein